MKKILFATTALVAGAAAGIASAAERPTGSVNGYMFFGAGLTDVTATGDTEVAILRDGEIHLNFSGSSDNGLTFAGRVELEAFTTGDQIDENWATVSGSFGEILVGSNDTAADNFGDVGIFCAAGCRIAYYDGFGEVPMAYSDDGGADPIGIRYATPTIAGFTAAVSYHPDSGRDGAADTARVTSGDRPYNGFSNVVSLAANYSGEFGGFGVTVGGDYTFGDATTATGGGNDMEVWSLGAELGYSGFTAGIHYENNEGTNSDDIAVGLRYRTGPWTFGGGYAFSDTSTNDIDTFAGWVSYALAPGVTGHVAAMYGDNGAGTDGYNIYTILQVGF